MGKFITLMVAAILLGSSYLLLSGQRATFETREQQSDYQYKGIASSIVQSGFTTINGVVKPLYQLRRYERQGNTFVRVGGSGPALTQFDIRLLTSGNLEADFFTVARLKLRLSVAVLPDFESDTHLTGYRQLHWGVTLDPPGLQ